MRPLCIYHAHCADGFTAAWVVRRFFNGEVDFHPGVYQDPPPNVVGRDVILVDFSYKRPVMEKMASSARSILILDHHKSSMDDLAKLEGVRSAGASWSEHLQNVARSVGGDRAPIYAVFDMQRSDAGLAWDYFFPGLPRPALINHVEDRDLWRFKLPWTREIQACVFSYPYDFEVWDRLMRESVETLAQEGHAIERKHFKDIDELANVVVRRMVIGGHNVPVANVPYTLTSDMGHKLAQGEAFAACYWDTPQGRVFSLRSTEQGIDVAAVAQLYGGGGHKHASGFRVSFEEARAFELSHQDQQEEPMQSFDTTRDPEIRGPDSEPQEDQLRRARGSDRRINPRRVRAEEPAQIASWRVRRHESPLSVIQLDEVVIARIAHEVNRAYCEALGDFSHEAWEKAPEWQRKSAIAGVQQLLANPGMSPHDMHEAWMAQKRAEGWKWGPTKDPEQRLHPCMVPFDQLPAEQRAKDHIFRAAVMALVST